MIFFLISCFSFILLSKSLSLKQNRQMKSEWSLLSPWFWKELTSIFISWLQKGRRICITFRQISVKKKMKMNKMKNNLESKSEKVEEDKISLLDLPDLTLECILERLSPSGLCSMAGVCSNLRDRCKSDHFWEKHMKNKWGRVIGDAAYREWQWRIASVNRERFMNQEKQTGFSVFSIFRSFSSICSLSWIKTKKLDNCNSGDDDRFRSSSCIPVDSIMGWYVSLESGRFWFPAQVYNRENGHVGFMLSCYDAQLSYDWQTNTFRARYAHHGRRTVEENIEWDRIRAPLVDTPPHVLHTSDCLNDLKPGDHIEIQWRRNKEFPYGWWYGVVGHLESCSRNENHCHCCYNDEVILEFKQYPDGSRWRQTKINRKGHREVGNEADGFYGGIRKLYRTEEISIWKSFWPAQTLQ